MITVLSYLASAVMNHTQTYLFSNSLKAFHFSLHVVNMSCPSRQNKSQCLNFPETIAATHHLRLNMGGKRHNIIVLIDRRQYLNPVIKDRSRSQTCFASYQETQALYSKVLQNEFFKFPLRSRANKLVEHQ